GTTTTNTSMCEIDCSTISTPDCQVSVCNEGRHRGTIGVCVVVPDEDDTPCDDSLFCTVDDACQTGICVGGPENDCGMTPSECMELYCDENSQSCGEQAAPPGAACQDPNDLCMKGATCNNGLCTGGTPEDCFFFPLPDDCHIAECNPQTGQCEAVAGNEGQPCVDLNDLCNPGKTCAAGVCQGGAPLNCNHLTVNCDLGVCDVNTGTCTTQSVGNGQPCDDLSACTTGETCVNGACSNGTPVTTCEQNGDGCCPSNCTAQNDLDCTVQPSCQAIKNTIPASTDGVYAIDPDLSGPIQQMQAYCDMTTDGGGWTLVAKIAGDNTEAWQWDTAAWTSDTGFGATCVANITPGCDGKSNAWSGLAVTQLLINTGLSTAYYNMVTPGTSMAARFQAFPSFSAPSAGQVIANRYGGEQDVNYTVVTMGDGDASTIATSSADRCMFHVRANTSQTVQNGFCAGRVRCGTTNTFVSFPGTVSTNGRTDYSQMWDGGSPVRGETMLVFVR
ncbi:MAG: hypothetical protein JRI68_26870, partial [Deltaproteobacteria bacterium]|nr:hypothetical protein [Deltaproteobacteria bacterium]